MPSRATLCVAIAMVSLPWTLIDPLRLPVRPMIARIVLVRPAPLRPSSVTTSPSSTWKFTPCSTCDSPYQACRSLTSSKRLFAAISMRSGEFDIRAAHVGLDHRRVLRNLLVRPFGERRAALQHRDRVGDARDHAHVVLDHQDRAVGRDLLDQLSNTVDVFEPHALRRLVEQHQLRVHRQGGGDLERALAAVAQLDRGEPSVLVEVNGGEQLDRALVQRVERSLSAWMWPRRTRRLTLLTATKPLNSRVSSRVSRMMSSLLMACVRLKVCGVTRRARGAAARRRGAAKGCALRPAPRRDDAARRRCRASPC